MLRTIIIPRQDHWTVRIPTEYLNRKIEILILLFDAELESEISPDDGIVENSMQADEETRLFWESFGSWQDDRTAEEIIEDIYTSRTSTERTLQL